MNPGRLVLLGVCLSSLACRGGRWVIADESPPDVLDAGHLERHDASIADVGCPTVASLDAERARANPATIIDARHVGLWRGSLAGSAATGFPSTALELSVEASGQGSLRFGAPGAPPGELDPNQGYLCTQAVEGASCGSASGFVSGFDYPLEAVVSRGDVLSFRIVGSDPWDAWCRLQTSQTWPALGQPCGSRFGAGPYGSDSVDANGCARIDDNGGATPIDCALMYALEHCRCGADGCVAQRADALDVGLQLRGGELGGSLWYAGELDAAAVNLSRQ